MIRLSFLLILFATIQASAQNLTVTPNGGNKKAWVGERVGLTDISINYDRPGVKGREGKIWGQLVPYGYNYLGTGTSKASPWRAGANENTTIEFSNPVKIEGQAIPAGKYGFFIDVQPDYCTIIFNKKNTGWGSYFYDATQDVLKVKVKQIIQDKSEEWLKYDFSNETSNSAVISLVWEKWRIPFKVETDLNTDQMNIFRKELTSNLGFDWKNWNYAANYAVNNNGDLQEALGWSENSISMPFVGESNFTTLTTKSAILNKLGRKTEADSVLSKALPMGSTLELNSYGRSLLQQKNYNQAMEIFKYNYSKHPNEFAAMVGMARGYSAVRDFDKALAFAKKAKPLAPNDANKTFIESSISKLEKKQDMN